MNSLKSFDNDPKLFRDCISDVVFQSLVDYRNLLVRAIIYKKDKNAGTQRFVIFAMQRWLGDSQAKLSITSKQVDTLCRTVLSEAHESMTEGCVAEIASSLGYDNIDLAHRCREGYWTRSGKFVELPLLEEVKLGGIVRK